MELKISNLSKTYRGEKVMKITMNKQLKKYLAIFFSATICLLSFCSCTNSKELNYSDTFVKEQDSQENFVSYQGLSCYASSGDSYYFIQNDNNGSIFLYSIDKSTKECHPLCNKSDCLHDKETLYEKKTECNAFLGVVDADSIVYYDHWIYYVISEDYRDKDGVLHTVKKICKKSDDGSKTEKVFSTEEYGIFGFKLHRGYLYLELGKWDNDDPVLDDKADIYRLPINESNDLELSINLSKIRKQYSDMWVLDTRYYGNHAFFEIQYTNNKKAYRTIINYNLQTNKWVDLGKKLDLEIETMFTVFNDKIFFGNGTKIYGCDYNGKNLKEVIDCSSILKYYNNFTPYCNDGENLFITGSNSYDDYSDELIVLDKEYNAKLEKLPIKFKAVVGFDEKAFIYNDENDSALYWIDKSDYSFEKIYDFSKLN